MPATKINATLQWSIPGLVLSGEAERLALRFPGSAWIAVDLRCSAHPVSKYLPSSVGDHGTQAPASEAAKAELK